jgi:predicted dehydrogenase
MRRNAEKAKDYALRHKVDKWYSHAEDLINDPDVNAIYIATPPLQHEEYTLAALKAGKPVYVEKPMSVNATAAQKIAEAAKETNLPLTVAHYRREQPLFKKVKELIDNKTIGEVRMINLQLFQPDKSGLIATSEENWRVNPEVSGGGLFHDLSPHQLDLMIYFFGAAKEAKGISLNQGHSYQADDITSGYILLEQGAVFTGSWCFSVPEGEAKDHCEIIGSKGKISFSVFEQKPVVLTRGGKTEEFIFEKLMHVQQPMIEKVVSYFLGKSPNPCPAEDGVTVMRLIDAFTKNKQGF